MTQKKDYFDLDSMFPKIANAIIEAARKKQDWVARDDIVQELTLLPEVSARMEYFDDEQKAISRLVSAIDWFSHKITTKESEFVDTFVRRMEGSQWSYLPNNGEEIENSQETVESPILSNQRAYIAHEDHIRAEFDDLRDAINSTLNNLKGIQDPEIIESLTYDIALLKSRLRICNTMLEEYVVDPGWFLDTQALLEFARKDTPWLAAVTSSVVAVITLILS